MPRWGGCGQEGLAQPETPLVEVVETLRDYHEAQMTTDPAAAEVPVTAAMRDVPVGAALQMIEDTTPGVRFVVADYGLLATTDTSEHAMTYISANEFWREQKGAPEPSAPRHPPRPHGDKANEAPPGRTPPSPPSPASDPFGPPPAPRPGAAPKDEPASDKGEKRPAGSDPFAS